MIRKIIIYIKDVFLLFFIIAVSIGIIYGVPIGEKLPTLEVSPFKLKAFDSGLALYQDGKNTFYSFSILNDYYIDQDGNRNLLIEWDNFKGDDFESNFNEVSYLDHWKSFKSYFGFEDLIFRVDSPIKVNYLPIIKNGNIQIKKRVELPKTEIAVSTGSTLKFNKNTIVYDPVTDYIYNPISTLALESFDATQEAAISYLIESGRLILKEKDQIGEIEIIAKKDERLYINIDHSLIDLQSDVEPSNRFVTNLSLDIRK